MKMYYVPKNLSGFPIIKYHLLFAENPSFLIWDIIQRKKKTCNRRKAVFSINFRKNIDKIEICVRISYVRPKTGV